MLLLSVCLPYYGGLIVILFTSELLVFISSSTQERAGKIPKKDDKKAADNFLYHRLLTVFSNIMCSMMVGHSIKLEN